MVLPIHRKLEFLEEGGERLRGGTEKMSEVVSHRERLK